MNIDWVQRLYTASLASPNSLETFRIDIAFHFPDLELVLERFDVVLNSASHIVDAHLDLRLSVSGLDPYDGNVTVPDSLNLIQRKMPWLIKRGNISLYLNKGLAYEDLKG